MEKNYSFSFSMFHVFIINTIGVKVNNKDKIAMPIISTRGVKQISFLYRLLTNLLFSDRYKYMEYTELSKNFEIEEMVVYPSFGICRIKEKEERNDCFYIKLQSLSDNSTVLVPEEKASSLGLRHLETKENVEKALSLLSDNSYAITNDWKQRLNETQNLLREGTLAGSAIVVNHLYRRQKTKALPTMEKKLYDTALSRLLDESSVVLDKDAREMRKIVFSRLENV